MSVLRKCCPLCSLFAFHLVLAGGPSADLGIQITVHPGGVTPPGTEGTMIIEIENQGPNTGSAEFQLIQTNDGTGLSFPPIEIPEPVSGPCTSDPLFDPPPGVFFPPWIIQEIPAGESRACAFRFTVLDTTKPSQIARWQVTATSGAEDPNQTNNTADVLLLFAEPPAPVSVPVWSTWAAMVLALMLGSIAAFALIRRSRVSREGR